MPHADASTDGERPASARQMLAKFSSTWTEERVRLSDIIDAMEDRVYGVVLLALAIPNIIPGAAIILGVPMIIIAGQLMLGYQKPRLPAFFGNRSMATDDFRALISRADPWLERTEYVVKRRADWLFGPIMIRVIGTVALLMAVILTLPIWGANFLPSLTIALIGLALIEHDGLVAVAAFLVGIASCFVAFGVVFAAIKLGLFILSTALS